MKKFRLMQGKDINEEKAMTKRQLQNEVVHLKKELASMKTQLDILISLVSKPFAEVSHPDPERVFPSFPSVPVPQSPYDPTNPYNPNGSSAGRDGWNQITWTSTSSGDITIGSNTGVIAMNDNERVDIGVQYNINQVTESLSSLQDDLAAAFQNYNQNIIGQIGQAAENHRTAQLYGLMIK